MTKAIPIGIDLVNRLLSAQKRYNNLDNIWETRVKNVFVEDTQLEKESYNHFLLNSYNVSSISSASPVTNENSITNLGSSASCN